MKSIQSQLPTLYEGIKEFGDRGIRGAIAYKLKEQFRFNSNIICDIGANIDNAEVFKSFAEEERYFSLSALVNLKEQIGVGGVYFDSVNEVASRINANDYVPNGALLFNEDAIDELLERIIIGNQASIKEASNFAIYPSTCQPWTEYLHDVSKFQISSIDKEELRNRELDNIQDLRKECQTLLSEAELEIESVLGSDSATYDQYAKKINDLEKWSKYQELLIQLLYQINNLDFTLYLGAKTKEHCFGSFELHVKKYDDLHEKIIVWHKENCDKFKIDINEARRKRTGLLAILEKPIGLVNEKWNYKAMSYETVGLIKGQTEKAQSIQYNQENPFAENVEIVINGDKKYYLLKE